MAWVKYAAQVEIARQRYIEDPRKPTIRELAEELGVPVESLYKYSAKEKWREKRREYTEKMLAETRKQLRQETAQAIARSEDSREKSKEILRFLRDGLTKAWQVALAHMVMPKNASPEEKAAILRRWEELSPNELLRFIHQAPKALTDIIKALELLEGGPTERSESTFWIEGEVKERLSDKEFLKALEEFAKTRKLKVGLS